MTRTGLLTRLEHVAPALAQKDMIPALTHLCFTGEHLFTYNDLLAIQIPFETDFEGGLEGGTLLGVIRASIAKDAELEAKKTNVLLKMGASRMRLPIMDADNFVFEMPDYSDLEVLEFDQDYLTGLAHCLISVGSDMNHPEHMGVTVEFRKKVILYSTDNATISEFRLPEDSDIDHIPIILPAQFCVTLGVLAKRLDVSDVSIHVAEDYVVAEVGEAVLFSKLIVGITAVDFPKMVGDLLKAVGDDQFFKIPNAFDPSIKQALVVERQEAEPGSILEIEGGKLKISTSSVKGQIRNTIRLEDELDENRLKIDPRFIARALPQVTDMCLLERSLALRHGPYTHLIAGAKEST